MTPIAGILILIVSLLGCIIFYFDLIYGLLIGMFALMAAAVHIGFPLKKVIKMMWEGIRESFIVVGVLFIIGAMTGIWRGCGTIPLLVVYSTKLIPPQFFILFAFLLSAAISYLIGTSFGTAASIGVVMMTLCHMSGADPVLTSAAILSGIFFGDRASPASSCALLNAHLTHTEIYRNVRIMLKDCIPAVLITAGLYTILSFANPLGALDLYLLDDFRRAFNLTPLLLIPAVIILIAPLVKLDIKKAMGLSILSACILALTIQKMPFTEMVKTLLLGYEREGELGRLLSGGGVRSMIHTNIMIMISATFSGIFNGTKMLSAAERPLENLSKKLSIFQMTALTSFPVIMFSCNQTLAMMLHSSLIRPIYEKQGVSNEQMMLDLANTTVVFSPLIPWCIAGATPLAMIGGSSACLPLAFYLYMPALVTLFRDLKKKKAAQSAV